MSEVIAVDRLNPDAGVMRRAASILRGGGVIVYPTETVYGIGANALDAEAVAKVSAIKQRSEGKPILVLVGSRGDLSRLVREIPEPAEALMKAFWPGPLTIVFPAVAGLPGALTRGTGTIGVRIPPHAFCLRLLEAAGVPLTSTSANIAGEPVPRTVAEIQAALGDGVDAYLDAGVLPASLPSTVIDATGSAPRLLRAGAIPASRVLEVVPGLGMT